MRLRLVDVGGPLTRGRGHGRRVAPGSDAAPTRVWAGRRLKRACALCTKMRQVLRLSALDLVGSAQYFPACSELAAISIPSVVDRERRMCSIGRRKRRTLVSGRSPWVTRRLARSRRLEGRACALCRGEADRPVSAPATAIVS